MKGWSIMKKILFIFIISVLFISCYIADNNGSDSGSITFKLPEAMKASTTEAKLRLRFFNDGDMDVLQGLSIVYLTDYPTPVSITGQNEFSYTTEDNGIATVTGVPSGRPLQILAEYLDADDGWAMSHAGRSASFTVPEGENTDIIVTLYPAVAGTGVTVNMDPFTSTSYIRIFDEDEFVGFLSISGSDITSFNATYPTPVYQGTGSPSGSSFTFTEAILPGRKFRLIISENGLIDSSASDVGVSGTFEVLPGLTKSVSVTYYTYTGSGNYSGN